MTEQVTENGKGIIIKQVDQTTLVEVAFESGGQKPKEWNGYFTDIVSAQAAITKYLARKKQEDSVVVNAPKNTMTESEQLRADKLEKDKEEARARSKERAKATRVAASGKAA